jgi:hypothetical protein
LIGVVLLLAALGVSVVLALVFVAAARSRMKEREQLLVESAADPEELEEARKHRPPLTGWLACSGIALVLVTGTVGLLVKSCSSIGRSMQQARDVAQCNQSLTMMAEWFGPYWDKNKKLPTPADVPLSGIDCPAGNDFRYVGHRKIVMSGARLLLVELQPHHNGERHALVVGEEFLKKRQTVAQASGTGQQAGLGGWSPNSRYFRVRTISEAEYESIYAAVEGLDEEPGE